MSTSISEKWNTPKAPAQPFRKHTLPGKHFGVTNVQQVNVNDGG